jgi:signal transduction histidine kinase
VVVVTLAVVISLVPLADALGGPGWYVAGPGMVAVGAVTGYALGSLVPPRPATVAVLAAICLLTLANQVDSDAYHWLDDLTFFTVVVGGPALAGAAVVARARQVRELTGLSAELGAQRRTEVEAARLEEQTRVQEQVHRQISQRVGAIALRAEGAQVASSTASVQAALAEVEQAGRAALDELRDALGSLREPDVTETGSAPVEERPGRPGVSRLDVLIALGCGAAMGVETLLISRAEGPAWANVVAGFAVAAPLLWRRSRPILVTAVVGVLATGMSLWLTPLSLMVTPLGLTMITAYAIGAWSRSWWWLPGLLVQWVTMFVVLVASRDIGGDLGGAVPVLAYSAFGVLLGRVTAGWQGRVHRIAATIEELEQGRGADMRMAMARERQALASSLHDSVSHAMTVVCLQAGAHQCSGDAESAREALETIAATARSGLTELRTALGELDRPFEPLDRAGIAGVARAVGVPIEVRCPPDLELRGPGAALGFRVVRESLVNVARHAPGARAVVTVETAGDEVRLEIADAGGTAGRFTGGTGTGLSGLAAEVAAAGGDMEWGRSDRGFRVWAGVPLAPRSLEASR